MNTTSKDSPTPSANDAFVDEVVPLEASIKAYSEEGLIKLFAELGQPRFRALQLMEWLYGKGASSYEEMSNLPATLRTELAKSHPLFTTSIVDRKISKDGTRKYVLEFADGARVETVAIPSVSYTADKNVQAESAAASVKTNKRAKHRAGTASEASGKTPVGASTFAARKTPAGGGAFVVDKASNVDEAHSAAAKSGGKERLTVCFSTQAGCPMACTFCATGKEGFTRNLLPGEIMDQILIAQADMGMRVSNLVGMGQGEPFLNYDNVLAALRFANHPKCLGIGARHITVSTCGILEGIRRFAAEPEQFTLAISLHSALQPVRDLLMPKMANTSLPSLRRALKAYTAATNRRVTLEYIMIRDETDSPDALEALIAFCDGLLCHVNLLPINAVPGSISAPSSPKTIEAWIKELEKHHVESTIRNSRGADIAGACGQLKNSL